MTSHRTTPRLLSKVLVLALIIGCSSDKERDGSPGDGGPNDAGGATGKPLTYVEYSQQLCDLQMPCCKLASLPSDGKTCRGFATLFASQVVFDAAEGRKCLELVRAATASASFCADVPDAFPPCRKAVTLRRETTPLGGSCTNTTDCAQPEGTVTECTNSFLDEEPGICRQEMPGQVGDGPCAGERDELGTSYVREDETKGLLSVYICEAPLACDSETGKCVQRAPVDSPPQSDENAPPQTGTFCSEFSASQTCGSTHYCDLEENECQPRKPLGATCRGPSQCAYEVAYCAVDTGVCTARRADGSPCESDDECSNVCTNGTCTPDLGGDLKWSFVCGGD